MSQHAPNANVFCATIVSFIVPFVNQFFVSTVVQLHVISVLLISVMDVQHLAMSVKKSFVKNVLVPSVEFVERSNAKIVQNNVITVREYCVMTRKTLNVRFVWLVCVNNVVSFLRKKNVFFVIVANRYLLL